MPQITFTVPGQPVAKGRARAFIRGGHVGHYTPEKTVQYESLVRMAAHEAMAGALPMLGAVHLRIVARFAVAASWSKKKKANALLGTFHHTSRPDLDNIVKAIKDGANGVVWRDDSQVVRIHAYKCYKATPGVLVEVTEAQ